MYVCMYMYMHICKYTHTHTHIYIYIRICVCICGFSVLQRIGTVWRRLAPTSTRRIPPRYPRVPVSTHLVAAHPRICVVGRPLPPAGAHVEPDRVGRRVRRVPARTNRPSPSAVRRRREFRRCAADWKGFGLAFGCGFGLAFQFRFTLRLRFRVYAKARG